MNGEKIAWFIGIFIFIVSLFWYSTFGKVYHVVSKEKQYYTHYQAQDKFKGVYKADRQYYKLSTYQIQLKKGFIPGYFIRDTLHVDEEFLSRKRE